MLFSLRQLDLEFMKRLHRKVNIVPVIGKADTLTAGEVKRLKERIMADIEDHQVSHFSITYAILFGNKSKPGEEWTEACYIQAISEKYCLCWDSNPDLPVMSQPLRPLLNK